MLKAAPPLIPVTEVSLDAPQASNELTTEEVLGLATKTLSRLSDGMKAFREVEGLLTELEQHIETIRELSLNHDSDDEVEKLEAEADRLEAEQEELHEKMFAAQREMQERSGIVADSIQLILDSTRDDGLLRRRIEGLRDALRREANQALDGRHQELHCSTLVSFAFQYAPRVA
jgi:hypothetical protein